MSKLNCWEIKKCGRESGGSKSRELGVCPAAIDNSCNGLNNGKNAGRICWAIAGTFCGGEIQGDFAQKSVSCMSCEVFKQIKNEEGADNFTLLKPGQVHQTTPK
ncbi:MAG: hypothetical protein KAJ10_02870 [Thermodesulfovibrionia bacterium]|nr:hypothetical protein [Thermodesulfovibrionia bacterium]